MQQIILALVLGAALATLAAVFVGNAYQDPHTVAPAHSTAASQQSLATGAAGTPAEQVLAAKAAAEKATADAAAATMAAASAASDATKAKAKADQAMADARLTMALAERAQTNATALVAEAKAVKAQAEKALARAAAATPYGAENTTNILNIVDVMPFWANESLAVHPTLRAFCEQEGELFESSREIWCSHPNATENCTDVPLQLVDFRHSSMSVAPDTMTSGYSSITRSSVDFADGSSAKTLLFGAYRDLRTKYGLPASGLLCGDTMLVHPAPCLVNDSEVTVLTANETVLGPSVATTDDASIEFWKDDFVEGDGYCGSIPSDASANEYQDLMPNTTVSTVEECIALARLDADVTAIFWEANMSAVHVQNRYNCLFSKTCTEDKIDTQFLCSKPTGLAKEGVCCSAGCGTCTGTGCDARPGGGELCCADNIRRTGKVCSAPTDVGCATPTKKAYYRRPHVAVVSNTSGLDNLCRAVVAHQYRAVDEVGGFAAADCRDIIINEQAKLGVYSEEDLQGETDTGLVALLPPLPDGENVTSVTVARRTVEFNGADAGDHAEAYCASLASAVVDAVAPDVWVHFTPQVIEDSTAGNITGSGGVDATVTERRARRRLFAANGNVHRRSWTSGRKWMTIYTVGYTSGEFNKMRDQIFPSIQRYFTRTSFGALTLKLKTIKAINVPWTCDMYALVARARRAAGIHGELPKDHFDIVLSPTNRLGCAAGMGSVAATGAYVCGRNNAREYDRISGCFTTAVHEWGHNLGLTHSHGLVDKDYGDQIDVMGSGVGTFEPTGLVRLDWLPYLGDKESRWLDLRNGGWGSGRTMRFYSHDQGRLSPHTSKKMAALMKFNSEVFGVLSYRDDMVGNRGPGLSIHLTTSRDLGKNVYYDHVKRTFGNGGMANSWLHPIHVEKTRTWNIATRREGNLVNGMHHVDSKICYWPGTSVRFHGRQLCRGYSGLYTKVVRTGSDAGHRWIDVLISGGRNVNCGVTYGEWSNKAQRCGKRSTYVTRPSSGAGRKCPPTATETRDCNVNCAGRWGDWSIKASACGQRSYIVTQSPKGSGKKCPSPTTQTTVCKSSVGSGPPTVRFGDRIIISVGSSVKTTQNCGLYGCRVGRMSGSDNYFGFDHGKENPSSFYVRPWSHNKKNRDCVAYGNRVVIAATPNPGWTADCG